VCEGLPELIFALEFDDRIQYDWVDSVSGIKVLGGSLENDVMADDPIPVSGRGVWLDGKGKFFTVQALQLNTNFTLITWVASAKPVNVLTVVDTETRARFKWTFTDSAFTITCIDL
jgi:hypothetical protein